MIEGLPISLATRTPFAPKAAATDEQLKQVTEEFEAIFVELMLRTMRESTRRLNENGPSYARDIYESWQDQAMAQRIVTGGGIGLAAQLYEQLSARLKAETDPVK